MKKTILAFTIGSVWLWISATNTAFAGGKTAWGIRAGKFHGEFDVAFNIPADIVNAMSLTDREQLEKAKHQTIEISINGSTATLVDFSGTKVYSLRKGVIYSKTPKGLMPTGNCIANVCHIFEKFEGGGVGPLYHNFTIVIEEDKLLVLIESVIVRKTLEFLELPSLEKDGILQGDHWQLLSGSKSAATVVLRQPE